MIGLILTVFLLPGIVDAQVTCDLTKQVACIEDLTTVMFLPNSNSTQWCPAVAEFRACILALPECGGELTYNSTLDQIQRAGYNIGICNGIVVTPRPTTYTPRPWSTTRYPTYTPKPWPTTRYPTDNYCMGKIQYCMDVVIRTIQTQQGHVSKEICPLAESAVDCLNELTQCYNTGEYMNSVGFMDDTGVTNLCDILFPYVSKAGVINSVPLVIITAVLSALFFM